MEILPRIEVCPETQFNQWRDYGVVAVRRFSAKKLPKIRHCKFMAEMKSRILIAGGATGYIGRHVAKASASLGHPTFAMVRHSTLNDPTKSHMIQSLHGLGITLVPGCFDDYEGLLKIIRNVDVVISAVGKADILEQLKIIKAIKEAGNIRRFVPSEFALNVDQVKVVEPAKSFLDLKVKIRRAVKTEGIPYTFVCCNFLAGFFLRNLGQVGSKTPPRDKIIILGDGNPRVVYSVEEDVGVFTIKAVDDPRTLNKTLIMRPPGNTLSFNELVALWERKIDKTLERVYLNEEQVLKQIEEAPFPANFVLALSHASYVRGDQTKFEIGNDDVEASELYKDVKYTTVDEYLDQFV